MAYRLEKNNFYHHKKISLSKKIRSGLVTLCICGVLITVCGRLANLFLISKSEEQYETTISYYDELINIVATYMKENGVDNPESCFDLYTKLLWNGYFSVNQMYEYDVENQSNMMGYYGIQIATGRGDCKNNEDFFYRIMRKLGYNAYQVACSQGPDSIKELVLGNHVITVVEDNGLEYYFDTTNACSYQKLCMNYVVNQDRKLMVTLKPLMSYIYGYSNEEKTIHLLLEGLEVIRPTSKEACIVNKKLDSSESQKVLVLQNSVESNLQKIYNTIKVEN